MNAVECAHPVAEDLSVGLLYVGANTMAVAMTFLGQLLLQLPEDSIGPKPLFPWAVASSGSMLIGLVPMLLFQGSYLRLEQDMGTTTRLLVDNEDDYDFNNRNISKASSEFAS